MKPTVDFWFDFVSAYSWLAMAQAAEFARTHGIAWRLRPFVLGAVVKQIGRRTVAQDEATRGYALFDIERHALAMGLTANGPPEHPFFSVPALRTHALYQDTEHALPLARELFAAAWERNGDLTDMEVMASCLRAVGLPAEDLQDRTRAPEVKAQLRANTDEALRAGVFGAPFFIYNGEPFWGNDRLPMLAARLGGAPALPAHRLAAVGWPPALPRGQ